MAAKSNAKKTIVVAGDVTADWNIARIRKGKTGGQAWNADDAARACLQPGGAAMLGELVDVVAKKLDENNQVKRIELPDKLVPGDPRTHHSYASWRPYPYSATDKKRLVWRVEEFLGLDAACGGDSPAACKVEPATMEPKTADIVVLDDAALGFRDDPGLWPEAMKTGKPTWIVVKIASPVAEDKEGTLWHHIVENHADRTIAIMTVNDLRRTAVHISRELSWERAAQDLFWELTFNPCVTSLSKCAHVVVSTGPAGALLLSRDGNPHWKCSLVFDPKAFEATWGKEHDGSMIGYTVCLTTAIARELLLNSANPDLTRGIKAGIESMRLLHKEGYGNQDMSKPLSPPEFPTQTLAERMGEDEVEHLAVADVPDPSLSLSKASEPAGDKDAFWTILGDSCSRQDSSQTLADLAERIVLYGHESVLRNVPLGQFGYLVTADRTEIEGYRSISALMNQYCKKPMERPLCFAVFGPPGAGKSFGVKQVAKSIGQNKIEDRTFNISQFNNPSELIGALHQVRDVGLSGKIPLVFWDEFDTGDGKWLRYFLAPMQDGEFQEEQITHHIGNAIFVFAGGTSSTIAEFDKGRSNEKFKEIKGPDFVSRLHGHLNVMGPNRLYPEDSHHVIRRAILLRGLLKRTAPDLFETKNRVDELQIDRGVLHAFLHASRFEHGVRSMETIISSSLLAGKASYEKSCLPSEAQLSTHVNGREFLALAQEPVLDGELLEKMAAGVHQAYSVHAKTWKTAAALKTYGALSEDLKVENRRNVKDIAEKLRRIGCVMVPARAGQTSAPIPEEAIEDLAEKEHERWMRSKIGDGWTYGPVRDDKAKKHPGMLMWRKLADEEWAKLDPAIAAIMGRDELPEVEKEKDRVVVRAIPQILAMAGYTVRKVS